MNKGDHVCSIKFSNALRRILEKKYWSLMFTKCLIERVIVKKVMRYKTDFGESGGSGVITIFDSEVLNS